MKGLFGSEVLEVARVPILETRRFTSLVRRSSLATGAWGFVFVCWYVRLVLID